MVRFVVFDYVRPPANYAFPWDEQGNIINKAPGYSLISYKNNTVTWWVEDDTQSEAQNNKEDWEYYYFALG